MEPFGSAVSAVIKTSTVIRSASEEPVSGISHSCYSEELPLFGGYRLVSTGGTV